MILVSVKRLTIRDIASACGVSPAAVSFALNNRPGISADNRERILHTATNLGWKPNPVARALSSARAGSVGIVFSRPAQTIRDERFYFPFLCGLANQFSRDSISIIFQLTDSIKEELEIYEQWAKWNAVDGVIIVDLCQDDSRPQHLQKLGIACVSVGTDPGYGSALVIDDQAAMDAIITHLFAQGYHCPAYVSGIRGLQHTIARELAFDQACTRIGLKHGQSYVSDYTQDAGAAITRTIMQNRPETDVVIYDNELLAFGGLSFLRAHGYKVPSQVGIFSWEDFPLAQVFSPTISALSRDPEKIGNATALLLTKTIRAEKTKQSYSRLVETYPTPHVLVRGTTAMRETMS